jgi:hypothetical protein
MEVFIGQSTTHPSESPAFDSDASLMELVISPGHARARLRHADIAVERQKAHHCEDQMPKRFGPRVRATQQSLLRAFTRDRVMPLKQTGREAEWLALDKIGQDTYQLQLTCLRKTSRGVATSVGELPLVFTGHFIERFIQSRRSELHYLIATCQACLDALLPLHVGQKRANGTRTVEWAATGDAWVVTPKFLLLGDVQPGECIVMRTVLRDDVLDPPKQLIWDRLQSEKRRLAVFNGGLEVPLQIVA